ncbi:MAG: magnesium transporter CorA family protein [Chlamydiales bacterium]|nr:magnesium transporter CorA family protein [Chlamydiales bacterium]
MLRFYSKSADDEEFILIPNPEEGCWIIADEANSSDINAICALTGLEYADLQDCLDRYEMPRLEQIKNHLLIFTRYPTDHEIGLYTSTLTIILSEKYFITISPDKSLLIETFVQRAPKISTRQKSKLLLLLLLKISQEFNIQIRRVRYLVLTQEKEMISVESEDITALTKNEEVLNQMLSALVPLRTVLQNIALGKSQIIEERDKEQADDLLNAIRQSEELCSSVVKSIRSLRDSYQIIFTNNLHKTIKLLTSLTIIFSIPTMIASLYGMNVGLPLSQGPHAFALVMGMIFFLSITGLIFFKRKRWL